MVQDANVKRMAVEKQLNEANTKVCSYSCVIILNEQSLPIMHIHIP